MTMLGPAPLPAVCGIPGLTTLPPVHCSSILAPGPFRPPMQRTRSLLVLAPFLAGCVFHRAPAPVPAARAAAFEPIWEAALASYRGGAGPDQVDRSVRRLVDSVGDTLPSRFDLFLARRRDPTLGGYPADWARRLVADQIVTGICGDDPHHACGGAALTSFVRLGDPEIVGDSATLHVSDVTEVPAECRRPDQGGFAGFHSRKLTLVHEGSGWRVISASYEMTGSGHCGQLPKAAREAMREDSLARRRASPIAGTYRYVVTLPQGDSIVIYGRTPRYPGSMIRGHRLSDVSAEPHPIDGYYLDGKCGFSLEALDGPRGESATCQHAVTLEPVLVSHDSTVWRGEPEADLAAWVLLDTTALGARLKVAMGGDDDRDPEWYFTPGYWVRHRDGRLTFHEEIGHGGIVLSRVRGERISKEVLPEN